MQRISVLFSFLGIRSDFDRVFFVREFNTLAGKSYWRLLLLWAIVTITLLAIGFASGSLRLLAKKMDNPFTNLVNITVRNQDRDSVDLVRRCFGSDAEKKRFQIKSVGYRCGLLDRFLVNQSTRTRSDARGMTVDQRDPVLLDILDPGKGNWLAGAQRIEGVDSIAFNSPIGIVVTESLLKRLMYEDPIQQHQVEAAFDSISFFLPVVAVVKELPDFCDYMLTNTFYNLFLSDYTKTGFLTLRGELNSVNIVEFVGKTADSTALRSMLSGILPKDLTIKDIKTLPFDLNSGYQSNIYKVYLSDFPSAEVMRHIFQQFADKWQQENQTRIWRFNALKVLALQDTLKRPHYLSFNLEKTDSVESFKQFMLKRFNYEINLTQIESQKNFGAVASLTSQIGVILFLFSLLSISVFVYSMMVAHIEKVKANLGTFVAFGLDNQKLYAAYLRITGVVIGSALVVAYTIAVIIDGLGVFGKGEASRFEFFNMFTSLATLLIVVISFVSAFIAMSKILKQTPGDLIYGREIAS